MDFKEIKEKYSKEQTVLETQIESLKAEIKNYRSLAGVSETATYEEILALANKTKEELEQKEKEVLNLIAELEKITDVAE
jgi:septation ring formation regulator EzrA